MIPFHCAALPILLLAAQEDPAATEKLQAEREAAFAELLTGSELVGYTTITDAEGELTTEELAKDSYTLKKVSKQEDGRWKFEAVIHYGDKPIPIAFPLPVEWAGETPMIDVNDMSVPFMGTYSARVIFHGNQYVGIWSGDGYGGHIFGRVVKNGGAAEGAEADAQKGDAGGEKKKDEDGDERALATAPARAQLVGARDLDLDLALDGFDSSNWPQFRGPGASGVAEGAEVPADFDIESGENVKWRIEVPGLAHSAPVIWGDKLFVTTSIRSDGEQQLEVGLYGDIASIQDESEFRFELHCFDKNTGEALWHKTCWTGKPAIKRHRKGSYAASTPAVDAERVVAFFGSEGLYAYDHDGEPLWERDFGVLDSGFFMVETAQWGFASSPVIHEDQVIVQCDVQEDSFLAVLDGETGKDVWRVTRKEEPGWSTPTVHVGDARSQIICNGWKHIGGYDLATGEELWTAAPGGDIPVPTPVVAHGLTFITNAHGKASPILAIDLDAKGHVSFSEKEKEYLAWGTPKRGNYMQTPIVYGPEAYFCRDNGVLTCYDAKSGETHYSERLDEGRTGYTGSAVAADGKVYFTSEEGQVITVLAGPQFEVIARSELGEEFMSTPALSEGVMYLRSREHLTAVAYE